MHLNGPLTEFQDGNVTIVVFGNELKQLDELHVSEIGQKLVALTENLPYPNLVLDMSVTEFFGSSFIEALFRVWKKLKAKPEAQFAIAGLQIYCREVLEVTHLDKLWSLYDTREAAIEALKKS